MRKKLFLLCFLTILLSHAHLASMEKRALFSLTNPLLPDTMIIDLAAFSGQVEQTLAKFPSESEKRFPGPHTIENLISQEQAEKTLRQMLFLTQEAPQEFTDPAFLEQSFNFIRWQCDQEGAAQDVSLQRIEKQNPEDIFITHFAAYQCDGRSERSEEDGFSWPLYQMVGDKKLRPHTEFTKQQVFAGALEGDERFRPIVWLRHQDLNHALQNGSIFVFIDGAQEPTLFNAIYTNGRDYNKQEPDFEQQERYLYYQAIRSKEDEAIARWEQNLYKTLERPRHVLAAGNCWNLGFGKILLLSYVDPESQERVCTLSVLAQWGGSFKDNLHSIKRYEGIIERGMVLDSHNLVESAEIYILQAKDE